MKKINTKRLILAGQILFIIFIFLLAIYNIISNYKSFLTFPIKDFLTILMALIVSYYLSHKKNDFRKLKEETDDIIEKIQKITILLRDYDLIDEKNKLKILAMVKNITTKFDILNKAAYKTGITDEIKYCIDELKQYSSLIATNPENEQALLHIQAKSYEHLSNIDNKLDEVQIKLYQ